MTQKRTVLVTGGAGFVGSHTCLELLAAGDDLVLVDNYANSSPHVPERIEELAGRRLLAVHDADVADERVLARIFAGHPIDAVIHFAARKNVRESVGMPLEYHRTNLGTLLALLNQMREHGVNRLVFSSSCSIYGGSGHVPLTETEPAAPTNPYARTKMICEQILSDVCAAQDDLRVIALRYFNPAGAHSSGRLGEAPRGVPGNVMPYLAQVALGRREHLTIFGDDWPTPDGTCVRDYIHVEDVAGGHLLALRHLDDAPGFRMRNLGSGVGSSVLDLVRSFERACGVPLPVRHAGRQPGDVATLIADPSRVGAEWGWRATRDLDRMCADAWRFQEAHPDGYESGRTSRVEQGVTA